MVEGESLARKLGAAAVFCAPGPLSPVAPMVFRGCAVRLISDIAPGNPQKLVSGRIGSLLSEDAGKPTGAGDNPDGERGDVHE